MDSQIIAALHRIQQSLVDLVQALPADEIKQRFHPDLPSLGWLLGRSVYLELYWLRKKILDDPDLARRVQHLFGYTEMPSEQQEALLPPKDHLLNWALEIQEAHITYFANPRLLPDHPWLKEAWLVRYLTQKHSRIYEQMIMGLQARAIQKEQNKLNYRVQEPLLATLPQVKAVDISQGHYRIGAREDELCFDHEQPVQMVELANFRIAKRPINNAEWLAFIEDGGYYDDTYWSEMGWVRKERYKIYHPWHWQKDALGRWYSIGLNGASDLYPDQPVRGISRYEAEAFARWAEDRAQGFAGAILPHEYHWEAAARLGALEQMGQVWEWCSNPMEPYQDYQPPKDPEMKTEFNTEYYSLRGTCLHSQPILRRLSIRLGAPSEAQYCFSGLRLLLPPDLEGDELYQAQWQKFMVQSNNN